MKKIGKAVKGTATVLIAVAIVFAAGFYVGRFTGVGATTVRAGNSKSFDLQLPGETEKMVVTVDEVKAKIREIGEFTSCEGTYTVTKGQDFTRYMLDDIPVPGTTNHIELTCTGIVKAGYNLEDITVRVDDDSKRIYVSLPDAKINSNQLLWDSSMNSAEKNNILNPIDFEQYQELIADIKAEGLQEAEKDGLCNTHLNHTQAKRM